MNKKHLVMTIILALAFIIPNFTVFANNGVDDLRGRWDVNAMLDTPKAVKKPALTPLTFFINDVRPGGSDANIFLASGCMLTNGPNAYMPLSLKAVYTKNTNSYSLSLYSTVVPGINQGEPYVIKFDGTVWMFGNSVTDDRASGTWVTESNTGNWSAAHHDRRVTKCPAVKNFPSDEQGDVYTHQDRAYSPARISTMYETHTRVVSSGMQVTAPDGTKTVVTAYTDLYSPDVDFISNFRFLSHFPGTPDSGKIYQFVLLDIFGNPIPGTESTDIWIGCPQGAPEGFQGAFSAGEKLALSWTGVLDVNRQFQPVQKIGFYQININAFNWEASANYGGLVPSTQHDIPWAHFTPPADGVPDGQDFGVSLSELQDGLYLLDVKTYSMAGPQSGGHGLECAVYDSSANLTLSKQGMDLAVDHISVISGHVIGEGSGAPLAGIEMGACEYQTNAFCNGDYTGQDGNYTIILPAGVYRVSANPTAGYLPEFYNDKWDWNQADQVAANAGSILGGIDFALTPAGTISGTVRDASGTLLAGIHVNACDFNQQPGIQPYCNGWQTGPDGKYSILLSSGTFRVFVDSQPGWANQFYNNTVHYDQAAAVSVTVGADIPGIDFVLVPGGNISGTVRDKDSNPIGGIGVDLEGGGYGACTDGNGAYTLRGIPFAKVTVVAGRDFCGPNPYDEKSQAFLFTADYTGLDFTLDLKP